MWHRAVLGIALVSFGFGAGYAVSAAPRGWVYDQHVGVVSASGGRACFVTKATSLVPKTKLQVIDLDSQQQRRAAIVAAADSCLDDVARGEGLRGYRIRFDVSAPEGPFAGIGLVAAEVPFRRVKGAVVADLDGDRRDEFFRACTSGEGIHFTIWTGAPLTGTRRWHQYHYLGYDVDATCTDGETREQ